MVRFAVPGQHIDSLSYNSKRLPVVPVVDAPRRPTTTDKKYPLWCEWRVNKAAVLPAVEGEFWKLVRFESNGDATWVLLSGGSSGPMVNIETDDGSPNVVPDGTGEIQIFGGAGIDVTGQGPGKTVTVSLTGGGAAIDQVTVDFSTGPGTNPVLPDGAGDISILGNTVANATNLNSPVATHSRVANAFNVEVQLATTVTPTPGNSNDVGLASFNENQFTIDPTSGMASLIGGGVNPPVTSFTLDDTNAATADGSGNIDVVGTIVANATNAKPLFTARTPAINDIDIELQLATTVTPTPGDSNDAGIASFNEDQFTIDPTSGMVSSNSNVVTNSDTVQTTDATPTTLTSIAIVNDTVVTLRGILGAQEASSANHIGGSFEAVITAAAGSASIVGVNVTNVQSDFTTAVFEVVASGANAIVQVTGEAATTIDWIDSYEYLIRT